MSTTVLTGTEHAAGAGQSEMAVKVEQIGSAEAWELASRICAAAGLAAQSQCALLELIGEFDAAGGVGWWQDIKSLAHWLSWACSMSPGTAREHVRVARALRRMPTVAAAFREGRLSYSKVREVTRVVEVIDEVRLCDLALTATASQLARMVSAFRGAAGHRIRVEREREVRWTVRDSGVVDVRIRLPKEEAAVLLAAVNAAKDHHAPDAPPPATDHPAEDPPAEDERTDATPRYAMVDAVLDLARDYLATAPEDRSGEDRTTVVVHVAADQLGKHQHPDGSTTPSRTESGSDVPAGTSPNHADHAQPSPSSSAEPTCQVQGLGGVEPETARKLACDNDLVGAVVDATGDVLALGRTRRLVSRAQRRALMIRDHGMCQFPGCHQSQHLKAHHIVHWADGGATDLDNLILLCQFHHTGVHEGQMTIAPVADGGAGRRWEFRMPDDTDSPDWWTATSLANHLARHAERAGHRADQAERQQADLTARIADVDHWDHPDAARIRPGWAGEPFDLHACVEALFSLQLPDQDTHQLAA